MDYISAEQSVSIANPHPGLCPPISLEYGDIPMRQAKEMNRRNFIGNVLKIGGAAIVGADLLTQATFKADDYYTSMHWPPLPAKIYFANGVDPNITPGAEWLVFGGLGQQDSRNSGQQLDDDIDHREPVASVFYPSYGFSPEALAPLIRKYIIARNIKRLNIVGISLGLPTALMTLRELEIQEIERINHNYPNDGFQMPEIGYIAAFSSPSDLKSAFDNELIPLLRIMADHGYNAEAIGELLYCMTDRNGDTYKLSHPSDIRIFATYLRDTIDQLQHGCPPNLFENQLIKVLVPFNILQQSKNYRSILTPKTRFRYLGPKKGNDDVVNDGSAFNNYKNGLLSIGIDNSVSLSTGNVDHANTYKSNQVLSNNLFASGYLTPTPTITTSPLN